jgi:hypothetical protein
LTIYLTPCNLTCKENNGFQVVLEYGHDNLMFIFFQHTRMLENSDKFNTKVLQLIQKTDIFPSA